MAMRRNVAAAVLACGFVQMMALDAVPAAEPGRTQHAELPIGIRINAADDVGRSMQAYEASVHRALLASGTPRNIALAVLDSATLLEEATPSQIEARNEELFRAAMAAPGDALVQWLIANRLLGSRNQAHAEAVVANATHLEPDNAAVWSLTLALASQRNDAAGIDEALARMATSTRSDEHFGDMLRAWFDIYDRNPAPRAAFADPADADTAPFVSAVAKAAALALPAYQQLVQVCKPSADVGLDATRAADCAASGHLMLHNSKTLIGRSIGFALVRNLGATTAQDQAMRRNLEWVRQNVATTEKDPLAMRAYQADWLNLDDEYEIVQRALRRAGLPIEPTPDWQLPERSSVAQAGSR
jgi:hypothetical protein